MMSKLGIRTRSRSILEHANAFSVWRIALDIISLLRPKELNHDDRIHRLENVLKLNYGVRIFFDTLQLWLESLLKQ